MAVEATKGSKVDGQWQSPRYLRLVTAIALAPFALACSDHEDLGALRGVQQAASQVSVSAPIEVEDPTIPASFFSARLGVAAAFNGTFHVAVWQDKSGMLRGSGLGLSGHVTYPGGVSLAPFAPVIPDDCNPPLWRQFPYPQVAIPGVAVIDNASHDGVAVYRDGDSVKSVYLYSQPLAPHTSLRLGNATGSRASVAAHANGFLAVWNDKNSIRARGLSPVGARTGPEITVWSGTSCARWPVVTCLSNQCLVAWEDYRSGSQFQIQAARVDPATGNVLDASSFRPDSVTGPEFDPVLANDGTGYLLGYYQSNSSATNWNGTVKAVRINSNGQGLDPQGITVGQGSHGPAVMAYGGGSYLFAWNDGGRDYLAARVANGTVLDVPPKSLSFELGNVPMRPPNHCAHGLSYDGTNFALQLAADTPMAARISPNLQVLDNPARWLAILKRSQLQPTVAFDGSNYLVGWTEAFSVAQTDARVSRVGPNGQRLDASPVVVNAHSGQGDLGLELSGNACGFLSEIWESYLKNFRAYYTVSTIPVTSGGSVNPPTGVIADNFQIWGLAASAGPTNHLATWHETRNAGNNVQDPIGVMARVISNSGIPISPAAIVQPGAISDLYWTSSASNGSSYLVAWSGIEAKRVSFSGAVLDSQPIQVATGTTPCVASDGQDYAVFSTSPGALQFTPVSSGAALGATTKLAISEPVYHLGCAFDGTDYWVVWSNGNDVYGWRVQPNGAVTDTSPILLADEPDFDAYPVLQAGANSQLLLAYAHNGLAQGVGRRIHVRLIEALNDGGAGGVGGTAGTKGAGGTGGIGPCGSGAGTGGSVGTGSGGSAGMGGSAGAMGYDAGVSPDAGVVSVGGADNGGCGGCMVAGERRSPAWLLMALMAVLALPGCRRLGARANCSCSSRNKREL